MSVTGYTKAGADAILATKAPRSSAWVASTAVKAGQILTNAGTAYTVNADFTTPGTFSTTGLTVVASGGGGGAVSSVYGRTGAVVAASGDYTAAQVGADAAGAAAAVTTTSIGAATSAALTSEASTARAAEALAAQKSANLSDLASAPTARTNLGLGSVATHAATEFVQAGLTVFTPEQYGAAGDRRDFADGAITSGSANLTSTQAAFVAGDVGKSIRVNSAGASGAHLVTTISSVSGGVATLATTAGTTVASAACGSFGTDDTTAIQSAINAASAANGTVQFLGQGYVCAGALQSPASFNSVLTIPLHPVTGTTDPTPQASLTLRGVGGYGGGGYWINSAAGRPPKAGTVVEFFAAASGTAPSGLSGGSGAFLSTNFNWLHLTMTDVQFRTAPNQGIVAVNLGGVDAVSLNRIGVDKNAPNNNASFIVPTLTNDIGIQMPATNNGATQYITDAWVDGYYSGIIWTEHARGDNLTFMHCLYALDCAPINHATSIGKIGVYASKNAVRFPSSFHHIVIDHLEIERDGGLWTTTTDINDAGGHGQGRIVFKVIIGTGGTGNTNLLTAGAWYINTREMQYYNRGEVVDGDTFPFGNRSDGTLGPDLRGRNYFYVGSWNIVTNRAQCSTTTAAYATIDRYRSNGSVGVVLQTIGTGSAGVCLAEDFGSSTPSCYQADAITGNLYRVVTGTRTSVATFTACTAGDTLRLVKDGKLITVYVNGVSVATYTDTTPLTGLAAGMFTINSTGTYFAELTYA